MYSFRNKNNIKELLFYFLGGFYSFLVSFNSCGRKILSFFWQAPRAARFGSGYSLHHPQAGGFAAIPLAQSLRACKRGGLAGRPKKISLKV
jgi:hypothetical protein